MARIRRKGGWCCTLVASCDEDKEDVHVIRAKTFTWSIMPQAHVTMMLYDVPVWQKSSCSEQMQSLNFGFATSRLGRHVPVTFGAKKKTFHVYLGRSNHTDFSPFTCILQHETTLFSAGSLPFLNKTLISLCFRRKRKQLIADAGVCSEWREKDFFLRTMYAPLDHQYSIPFPSVLFLLVRLCGIMMAFIQFTLKIWCRKTSSWSRQGQ